MSNKRTILLFVVLAYVLAWIIWLALWIGGVGLNSPWSQLASIVAMWMPALAVFLLGKITNQPSGIKSKLAVNFERNWRFYLLAIWLPAVISFLGAGLYFLVFPSNFSLGFESIQAILQAKGVSQSAIPLSFLALIQILASLTYAPFGGGNWLAWLSLPSSKRTLFNSPDSCLAWSHLESLASTNQFARL